ncbi:MAG: hypothetical protein LPK19_04880 [Hymenobacteraceae bacterium]|nr:hypothetical protein [Hymenobacteraceae bacterium]MDX5395529.1 hypothetical protein [Hymenobacteraceae bacterium]MDX5511583.1 hypothetical protein [Hymenobacteraceae bacterium]
MQAYLEFVQRNRSLDDFLDSITESNLTFYASDLIQARGCSNLEELAAAINKATQVCSCMNVPVRDNFKPVFRSGQGNLLQDWKLSPLAYYLTIINSDSSNKFVARMQVEMARRMLNLNPEE